MYGNVKILFTVICLFAAFYKTQAYNRYLQCWHCSSDTVGAENFCDIDFSERSIPTDLLKEYNISIVRSCNSTISSDHERPVCRKTVEEVNGKTITKRFCYYTNKSDPLDHCQEEATDKNVRRVFCEDCLTDKCNAAPQMLGMAVMLTVPILIVKIAIF